jgi:thiamine-phosphate pyrophosphorylase
MIRCYVTDRRQGDLKRFASAAIQSGVDFIQIREKDLDARSLFDLVCAVRDAAAGTRTQVLVNGRLDIALAAGIDGVHLPGNGLPADRVRPLVRTLSCSVHSVEEAVAAERSKVDFVIFGPVFETPGKSPVGLEALKGVVAAVRIPVLAIGGINQQNIASVLEAGSAGIAAIRLFQQN